MRYFKRLIIPAAFLLMMTGAYFLYDRFAGGVGSLEGIERPNVLILSIESFRRDHMGLTGYSRPITPVLDNLAYRGVYFERAYSQASWTRPSIASTLSSTYPSLHRVSDEDVVRIENVRSRIAPVLFITRKLSDSFSTIPEIFQSRGYRCYGWSYNQQIWEGFGFQQGFDEYSTEVSDEEIVRRLIRLFGEKENHPFFVFTHFLGPHLPYNPEERFRIYDSHPEGVDIDVENFERINKGEIKLSREDIDHNIALYDGAIRATDAHIGEILEALDEGGLRDRTIIVVMADHGEEFYDHGGVGHGESLYEEVIRVPLIIAGPGFPEERIVDVPVQNIDLMPTLTELIFGFTPEGIQGNSLLPLFRKKNARLRRPVYSEIQGSHAVILEEWKYILVSLSGAEYLFNLAEDPLERRNLAGNPEYEPVRRQLEAELEGMLDSSREWGKNIDYSMPGELPDEVIEGLKSLGYIR